MKRFVREKGKVAGAAVGEMPAQWSAAMPLCACTECIRRGYVSPEEAQRMHAAAALAGRKTRGRISSAVEEVQRKVHERQCQRVYPAPKDITQQHIEEALSITKGDTEKAARLLIDFKGRTSKDLAKVADMDPNCIVCYGADKDIAIEPCGHLICHKCFDKIRQSASSMQQTCPYCRAPITGARPALLKGNDTMAEVETEFGTLTCLSDEEEEEEVVNLSEARRQSVKSTKS
eukprot:m.32262 g.32262  ORF g.32262 m.32262 type:complete len:232 (+) comp7023_c0_seq2:2583-3278(+)